MKSLILDNVQIENKINRLAHELLENNFGEGNIFIVGLNDRGSVLAEKIVSVFKSIYDGNLEVLHLQAKRNEIKEIEIAAASFEMFEQLKDSKVILIDDVVDSGQTLMYAASFLLQFHPKALQTLALIDRNHRLFPIKVDYVGHKVATTLHEQVKVEFEGVREAKATVAFLM
jgi:pyrimidine operon attenuation protein/uracil phosphoribosyltransferase